MDRTPPEINRIHHVHSCARCADVEPTGQTEPVIDGFALTTFYERLAAGSRRGRRRTSGGETVSDVGYYGFTRQIVLPPDLSSARKLLTLFGWSFPFMCNDSQSTGRRTLIRRGQSPVFSVRSLANRVRRRTRKSTSPLAAWSRIGESRLSTSTSSPGERAYFTIGVCLEWSRTRTAALLRRAEKCSSFPTVTSRRKCAMWWKRRW